MAFRGWLDLSGFEVANSSRVIAHLRPPLPTDDSVFAHAGEPCGCGGSVSYDDSWPDLADWLGATDYQDVTTAPWYDAAIPQSAEFRGIWPMKIDGLDAAPIDRTITELIGDGAVSPIKRTTSRRVTVDAVLIACTSAGLQFGIRWLTNALNDASAGSGGVLSYLDAHPGHSAAGPDGLLRNLHSVVLTEPPVKNQEFAGGMTRNREATSARVTWTMTALVPHAYRPGTAAHVAWNSVSTDEISWVHATDCSDTTSCPDMPVLFSTECVPQAWPRATYQPPVCGGCIPVGDIKTYRYTLPDPTGTAGGGDTAVSVRIVNTGGAPLSLQGGFESRAPGACPGELFPFQVAGLPTATELVLDAVTGRNYAVTNGVKARTAGILSTPRGRPWRPALIDQSSGWDLVVRAAASADFEMELTLLERDQ